jgi:hypothetical protein
MPDERQTIDGLLRESRVELDRLSPERAHAAMRRGALLIDIRSDSQRAADGVVPSGALFIARNVLEWRLDPSSGYQHPAVGGLERQIPGPLRFFVTRTGIPPRAPKAASTGIRPRGLRGVRVASLTLTDCGSVNSTDGAAAFAADTPVPAAPTTTTVTQPTILSRI